MAAFLPHSPKKWCHDRVTRVWHYWENSMNTPNLRPTKRDQLRRRTGGSERLLITSDEKAFSPSFDT
jgi:hypothetical protein